jgi:hypothetical protein
MPVPLAQATAFRSRLHTRFEDDAPFVRQSLTRTSIVVGTSNQSGGIIFGSVKMKW